MAVGPGYPQHLPQSQNWVADPRQKAMSNREVKGPIVELQVRHVSQNRSDLFEYSTLLGVTARLLEHRGYPVERADRKTHSRDGDRRGSAAATDVHNSGLRGQVKVRDPLQRFFFSALINRAGEVTLMVDLIPVSNGGFEITID